MAIRTWTIWPPMLLKASKPWHSFFLESRHPVLPPKLAPLPTTLLQLPLHRALLALHRTLLSTTRRCGTVIELAIGPMMNGSAKSAVAIWTIGLNLR